MAQDDKTSYYDGGAIGGALRDEVGRGAAGDLSHAARKTWFRRSKLTFADMVLMLYSRTVAMARVGADSLDLNIQSDSSVQHFKLNVIT